MKTEKEASNSYFPKMTQLPSHNLLKYLWQNVSNRDKSIVSEFLSDRGQRLRLDRKVSASGEVVLRVLPSYRFRAVAVYIVHLKALPHCWELYYEVLRMILRSMQLLLNRFCVLK